MSYFLFVSEMKVRVTRFTGAESTILAFQKWKTWADEWKSASLYELSSPPSGLPILGDCPLVAHKVEGEIHLAPDYSDEIEEQELASKFNPIFRKFLTEHGYSAVEWHRAHREPGFDLYDFASRYFGEVDEYGWPIRKKEPVMSGPWL